MLNKEVCKICKQRVNAFAVGGGWDHLTDVRWDTEGWVTCPYAHAFVANVTSEPDEDCPYIAEHVVSQNAE